MDNELTKIIEQLVTSSSVMELVKVMQPLDMVAVLVRDFDLCPHDASKATLNLIKHSHDVHYESDLTPGADMKRWHFPPDPRQEPSEWPFDDMTKAVMDPKNKGKKRPLMQGKDDGEGNALHQKNAPHFKGNAGFTKDGYSGWSKSPSDKEFNLPGEENPSVGVPPIIFRFSTTDKHTGHRK